MVNQAIANQYFIGVGTSRSLIVQVDPTLLSKVNDDYLGWFGLFLSILNNYSI